MSASMLAVHSFIRKVEALISSCDNLRDETAESAFNIIIHQSVIFSQMLKTMEYIRKIKLFVDAVYAATSNDHIVVTGDRQLKNSAYMRTFADSIVDVLAGFFKSTPVIKMSEQWIEVSLEASDFLSSMKTAEFIFRDLEHLINEIIDLQLYGCQILSLTKQYTNGGNPPYIEQIFQRIHSEVELVMLRQISTWVVKGELSSDELFVKMQPSHATGTSEGSGKVAEIDATFVPEYMKFSLAQKILSIGQLLIILKQVPADVKGTPDVGEGFFGLHEEELLGKFKGLEKKFSTNLTELEKLIESLSLLLNERAVTLCWEVGGLKREMELLSEVALLTRSDLASRFLSSVGEKLLAHPRVIGNHLIFTRELESAAEDIGLDPCVYSSHFQLVLPSRKTVFPSNCDTLSVLKLRYKVPWPLHFIIGDHELAVLGSAFNLLVRIHLARLHAAKAHFAAIRDERENKDSILVVHLHWLSVLATELESHFLSNVASQSAAMRNGLAADGANIFELRRCFCHFVTTLTQTLFLPAKMAPDLKRPDDGGISLCVHRELVKVLGSMEITFDAVLAGDESLATERFHNFCKRFQVFYHLLDEASTVQNVDSATSLLHSLKPVCSTRMARSAPS